MPKPSTIRDKRNSRRFSRNLRAETPGMYLIALREHLQRGRKALSGEGTPLSSEPAVAQAV